MTNEKSNLCAILAEIARGINIPEWAFCNEREEEASIIATNEGIEAFHKLPLYHKLPQTCEDVACDIQTGSWLATQGLRMEYNGTISEYNCEENKSQEEK